MKGKTTCGKNKRSAELATIHIRKEELQLSDDEYRDLLQAITGMRSAKDLDFAQRRTVLDHFNNLAKKKGIKVSRASRTGISHDAPKDKAGLLAKINALLLEQGVTREYLERAAKGKESMVKRLAKVDKLEFSNAQGLHNIVAALTYQQQRRQSEPS